MKKSILSGAATLAISILILSSSAGAAIIDISVTAAGDRVYDRYWGWFGSGATWITDANPNIVYHDYYPGDGRGANTSLSFDLSSFSVPADDIASVSLNYKILESWTQGRDDIGSLNGIGSVLYSNGTGWKYFDITDSFKTLINSNSTTADYTFSYTGYSGFTFASAEGGDPAYLRITTANTSTAPVPLPASILLLGTGIAGLIRRKKNLYKVK